MEVISPRLAELTKASSLTVGVVQLGGARGPELSSELVHVHGLEAEPYLRYLREHILEDPLHPHALRADGRPVVLGDHLGRAGFGRTAFTRFLREIGIRHVAGCALRLPDGSTLLVGAHRAARRRDFGPSDRVALELLSADLARAAATTVLSRMLEPGTEEQPFAAVALDPTGRVAGSVGPLSERAFAELGSEACGRVLAFARQALARPGAPGESIPLVRCGALSARLVHADRASGIAGLLVLLREGDSDHTMQVASQLPGVSRLTPREREVLTLLLQRRSNEEIATRLGAALATVRSHLQAIYQKLRRNRRGLQQLARDSACS